MKTPTSRMVPNTGALNCPAVFRLTPTVGVMQAPWEAAPFDEPSGMTVLRKAPQTQPIGPLKAQQIGRLQVGEDTSNQQLASKINELITAHQGLTKVVRKQIGPLTDTFDQLQVAIEQDAERREQDRQVFFKEQARRQTAAWKSEILMAVAVAAATALGTMGVTLGIQWMFRPKKKSPAGPYGVVGPAGD